MAKYVQPLSYIGVEITCAETGKRFIGASDGFTTNYAHGPYGSLFSDEGVNLRERRALLDRIKPFSCYVSEDGQRITGWKGNELGKVILSWRIGNTRTNELSAYRVRDCHGGFWHGRGSPGMCINLSPTKG